MCTQLTAGLDPISTVAEVAEWFKTPPSAIYALIRTGRLDAVRLCPNRGGFRIPRHAVEEYLTRRAEQDEVAA